MKQLKKHRDLINILLLTILSLFLGHLFKNIGSAIWAILSAMTVTQFIKHKDSKIVNTTLKRSLNTTIILLGFSINVQVIMTLGFKTLGLVVISIILTILILYLLAKLFKFNGKFSLLFAIGNGICGSSAIMSANNYIKSKTKDFNLSVSIVNIMGVVLMFTFPLLFNLIHHNINQNSFIIGSTIQSVAQVLGASEIAGPQYINVATLIKMTRVFMLIFVLIILGLSKRNNKDKQNLQTNTTQKLSSVIPLFLVLFIGAIILTNTFSIPTNVLKILKEAGHILETIALTCIGYQIVFKDLLKDLTKIFTLMISALTIQILFAELLVLFI